MPRSKKHGGRGRKQQKRRKGNKGSFKPGFDPRRHRFSTGECRVGYWVTMLGLTPRTKDPAVREWVRTKVCIHNRSKDERRACNGGPTQEER